MVSMMNLVFSRFLLGVLLCLTSTFLFADQAIESKELITSEKVKGSGQSAQNFVIEIISSLESKLLEALKDGQLSDDLYLDELINKQIFPYIDMSAITKKITGSYWVEVIKNNDELLMQQAIKASLLRTYRIALGSYNGETIEVGESKDKPKFSLVRVTIITATNKHRLDFAVRPSNNSWLIFDVSIDGIVFTKTLRSSLKPMFEKNTVKEVIQSLTEH